MDANFYVEIINPDAKLFKHLYELDIIEKRGREEFSYRIFWPGNSLKIVKAQTKVWAEKERVQVINITEKYVKPSLQQDLSSNNS